MANVINFMTKSDSRGDLTVIEKVLDYTIKRVYYIYNCDNSVRGGHSHKVTKQTLVSVKGSCRVNVHNSDGWNEYILDNPAKALYLEPEDYHTMEEFTEDCVLLVLASDYFDAGDYIDEDIWE